jgi:phospholipid-binding lipoprotein MlaA
MIKAPDMKYIGKAIVVFAVIAVLTACSSAPVKQDDLIPAKRPVSEIVKEDVVYAIDVYDPWEGFNRRMYKFNAKFDRYIFLPVVNAYETVTPDMVEDGVSNFFQNLNEVTNLTNSILQLKGQSTVKTIERILINTTIGI